MDDLKDAVDESYRFWRELIGAQVAARPKGEAWGALSLLGTVPASGLI